MNIAILGGGIGGLSAAIALKISGFDVEVYERHSTATDIGAGIVCWPNASFVLAQLGILEDLTKVSGSLSNMNRFSVKGEPLGSLDIKQLDSLMGYGSYSVLRKDLMRLLSQRLVQLNITVHYQHQLISLDESDNEQVIAKFSNGKSIKSDIIIGADGRMNSIARQYVNNDNQPIYQGFVNWVGIFESEKVMFPDISVSDYWGIGERFGIVPVSVNKAYWAGGAAIDNISKKAPAKYKLELAAIFEQWPEPITEIITKTPLSQINKIFVHDHHPINNWHKNNVLLLGDAAHAPLPTSGQGACQALEDAWHFARILKDNSADITAAFCEFIALREEKTRGITMIGRQLASSIFNRDKNYCQQRNLASKNTDYHAVVTAMAKGWASDLPIGQS